MSSGKSSRLALVRRLHVECVALWLACRDPRTPWQAKALAIVVVAYFFSPVDLIPDFLPVVGHLDDLVLIPLGVALTLRMIPRAVVEDCRRRAEAGIKMSVWAGWTVAAMIVALWSGGALWLVLKIWPPGV